MLAGSMFSVTYVLSIVSLRIRLTGLSAISNLIVSRLPQAVSRIISPHSCLEADARISEPNPGHFFEATPLCGSPFRPLGAALR